MFRMEDISKKKPEQPFLFFFTLLSENLFYLFSQCWQFLIVLKWCTYLQQKLINYVCIIFSLCYSTLIRSFILMCLFERYFFLCILLTFSFCCFFFCYYFSLCYSLCFLFLIDLEYVKVELYCFQNTLRLCVINMVFIHLA